MTYYITINAFKYWAISGCAVVLAGFVSAKVTYWFMQGKLLRSIGGYLTPPVTRPARLTRAIILRGLSVLFAGKIAISGAEKIEAGVRTIFVANHQTEMDTLLMGNILKTRNFRYLIARYQTAGCRAPLAAWTGAILVDFRTSEGGSVALKAAKALIEKEPDSDLMIFPQGGLHTDNIVRREDIKPGVALLSRHAIELGQTINIQPFGIKYKRDRKDRTLFHRLLELIRLPDARRFFGDLVYGVDVEIGEPFRVTDDMSIESITDEIFYRINCALAGTGS